MQSINRHMFLTSMEFKQGEGLHSQILVYTCMNNNCVKGDLFSVECVKQGTHLGV